MSFSDTVKKAKENRKIIIPAAISIVLWIAFTIYTFVRFGFRLSPLFFLLFALLRIKPLKFEREYLSDLYFGLLTSLFTFYTCQMVISFGCGALRQLLSLSLISFIWNVSGSETIIYSIFIFATLYMLLRLCRVNAKVASAIVPVPFLLFSIADVFVASARGYELIAVDLINLSTAKTVASNYNYDLKHVFFYAVIPYALFLLAITNLNIKDKKIPVKKDVIRCALATGALILATFLSALPYQLEHVIRTYNYGPSYANTFVLNLIYSFNLFHVKAPVDYSISYIDQEAEKITARADASEDWLDDDVNIIVIMNEAYADIGIYEKQFGSYTEPAPFFYELTQDENCISGYYLASIFGSNTANSEFEFLTGLSLGYINDGMVPYTAYITREVEALPHYLATQGYTSFAMHPNLSQNWRRNTVYPFMGFDKMIFEEKMTLTSADYYRNYPTDMYAYRTMVEEIDTLQNEGNDRIFAFLITMQNHGGFADFTSYSNFTPSTYVTKGTNENIEIDQMNSYLSLIHESDVALEYLVNWIKEQDEKYVLFFFGDHQPSVSGLFNSAEYTQQSYEVPFFLWANYDIPEEVKTSIKEQYVYMDGSHANTSMNFCALDVLRYAGIPYSPYYQTLSGIRKDVPMINCDYYYDVASKDFQLIPDGEQPNDAMKLYSYLEYDALFDKKNSNITDF